MTENKLDPKDVASNVYNFIMENERVRVFNATFDPDEIAAMHHHPDHVVYVLRGGKIELTSGGKTNTLDLETGKAIFITEQDHEAKNVGQSKLELLVVELKK
jgi:quercetin dioxygenase-like cupin family protein